MTQPRSIPPLAPGQPALPPVAGNWRLSPDLHLIPDNPQTAEAAGLAWIDPEQPETAAAPTDIEGA